MASMSHSASSLVRFILQGLYAACDAKGRLGRWPLLELRASFAKKQLLAVTPSSNARSFLPLLGPQVILLCFAACCSIQVTQQPGNCPDHVLLSMRSSGRAGVHGHARVTARLCMYREPRSRGHDVRHG